MIAGGGADRRSGAAGLSLPRGEGTPRDEPGQFPREQNFSNSLIRAGFDANKVLFIIAGQWVLLNSLFGAEQGINKQFPFPR
jgi:hypothetical protein